MDVPSLPESILAPARLLVRTAGQWLPFVVALAMLSALPEIGVQIFAPEALAFVGGWTALDVDLLFASLGVIAMMWCLKLLLELVAYMLVFVVLADLTAGRAPALGAGLRRLASWRLQFAWILAGFLEQTAIDLWWLGAAFLLLPFGLATVSAYEEDNGFSSFGRSFELGTLEMGDYKPGTRIAIAVTCGFALGFLVNGVIALISFLFSGPGTLGPILSILSGTLPDDGFALPTYDWKDAAKALLLAPLALLPTVYMMATQQMVYWQARKLQEARAPQPGGY